MALPAERESPRAATMTPLLASASLLTLPSSRLPFTQAPPMQLDHHRERSAALGLEETCQEGLITMPQIFHVFDLDFIGGPYTGRHAKLL